MPDDFVVNVRQIVQYPLKSPVAETDLVLLQESSSGPGAAGAYRSATVLDLVSTALMQGGFIHLAPDSGIAWNGAALTFSGGLFSFTEALSAPSITTGPLSATQVTVNGQPVATQEELTDLSEHVVTSMNGRTGDVQLETQDILRAGAAPIRDAHFGGFNTSPTPWDVTAFTDQIATTAWVQQMFCFRLMEALELEPSPFAPSTQEINDALLNPAPPGVVPRSVTPPLGDVSTRIATTAFVDESATDIAAGLDDKIQQALDLIRTTYAPLDSPQFTGMPSGPTANPGSATGQLATTAFVTHAIVASTTGVASFNTRTGAVVLTEQDLTAVGGALLASPQFTGAPMAPTAATATNTDQLATTAFVHALLASIGGVTTFNGRTGAVSLMLADVTGTNVLNNTPLIGTPTAPTAAPGTSTVQVATTAFVQAALAAAPGGVSSFNTRTGAITLNSADVSSAGGALVASPTFTGTPAAPTAAPGTSTTQLATTAFVQGLLASPALTGVPTAPTATAGTNTTQLATTAFVMAAVTASTGGVSSFNTRTGAVTLTLADVTGTNVLNNTPLTGVPTAPTAAPATNTTQVATTAFVTAAIAAMPSGGVTSFNSRTGAVTLTSADVSASGGALINSPTFTGTPAAPTPAAGSNDTSLATTAWVMSKLAGISSPAGKQTIWVPAAAMTPNLTLGAAPIQTELPNNKIQIRGLSFDPNTTWFAQFEIAMPKSWNQGTVTFMPVWSAASASNLLVVWGLQAVAVNQGGVLDTPFGTAVTVMQGNAGNVVRNTGTESAAVTIGNIPSSGAVVIFQIYRDAPNASDTLTVAATLHGINVYYTTNAANDA